ncbi:hypothetical protein [Amycolatopsis sp. H20-H5]|uniref:hypothetical protein n=1 Tax=Amycolatopsis sp. H20-H5 TaxID=3046309 RepID=UPI002DB9502C|nr:hypothetical protein [Amycolatopsis sp. H20-H5]MEC3982863.1 hypothetical protein [Amycolatopsis sp. H20-H5]
MARPFVLQIRCDTDGYTHAVTDEEFAAGRHKGQFRAICGHVVVASAMTVEPGRLDPLCRDLLRGDQPAPAPVPIPSQRRWPRVPRRHRRHARP